jgi:hypothetical protein
LNEEKQRFESYIDRYVPQVGISDPAEVPQMVRKGDLIALRIDEPTASRETSHGEMLKELSVFNNVDIFLNDVTVCRDRAILTVV